jgi:Na+-translocating ferredoxin:NAD+ oxidoreductase RnfC subunit
MSGVKTQFKQFVMWLNKVPIRRFVTEALETPAAQTAQETIKKWGPTSGTVIAGMSLVHYVIDKKVEAAEKRADDRAAQFEKRADDRAALFEKRADDRAEAFEKRADDRAAAFEKRADDRAAAFAKLADERAKVVDERIKEVKDDLKHIIQMLTPARK